MVDFFLGLAIDLKRNRFTEREHRPAVETGEALPVELEADGHDRTFGPAVEFESGVAVMGDGGDFRMVEDRAIELRRLFGLIVEPQAGREFLYTLHGGHSSAGYACWITA
ncbi:hypothetical protein D3C86_1448730 [compost metagenome]